MKSFAKRLLELQTREQLDNTVKPQSNFPQTTKVHPRLLKPARQSIDHFQRNFEELQGAIKMLSREKLQGSKSLAKRQESPSSKQPLAPLERNTILFTPARTERQDWVKQSPTANRFFKGEDRELSKSVVLPKSQPKKPPEQIVHTEKRASKNQSFSTRMSKNNSPVENVPKLGLPNIGNSCYINATVQCLFHLPNFNRIFESQDLETDLNPKHRGAAIRYAQLYLKLKKGQVDDRSTFFLKRAVSKKCSLFLQWNQQDAHEFTQQLLDSLHEDLNRIEKKPQYRNLQADRRVRVLSSLATQYWNYYRKRDDSHVTDYFSGQILSSVVCCGCAHQSLSFDNFLDLSLPMQRGSKTLHELIDNFLQVEELTDPYFCSKCKRYNKSRRKLDLWKTPKLLMIQLKRFKYGKLTKQKIKDKLKFPIQGLNIRQFMNISTR